MTARRILRGCIAARATSHLVTVRDALELAGRPPGERITITRQNLESILDDLGIVGRLIREMADHQF
jgi:hypothetical protein